MPQMAVAGDRLVFAWTNDSEGVIHTAVLPIG
jgi:hypothetical protein